MEEGDSSVGNKSARLSVMDRCPMPAEPQLLTLFEVFAARAAAEYRRLRVELMCALKRASFASDSFTSTLP
jgi:hypothetical protein